MHILYIESIENGGKKENGRVTSPIIFSEALTAVDTEAANLSLGESKYNVFKLFMFKGCTRYSCKAYKAN